MTSFVKLSLMLNVLTLALLPMASGQGVDLPGPIQSSTTAMVPTPVSGARKGVVASTVDSNGCDLLPPVAGYAHWYDSRDIDGDNVYTDQNDGDAVSTWVDKGSAAKNLAQGTAGYRPLVETNCNSITGAKCVLFDGTDDYLRAATAADWNFLSNNNHTNTIVATVCYEQTSPPTWNAILSTTGTVSSAAETGLSWTVQFAGANTEYLVITNGAGDYNPITSKSLVYSTGVPVDTVTSQACKRIVFTMSDSGNATTKYVDGLLRNSSGWATNGHSAGNPLTLAATGASLADFSNVSVGQLLIYTSILTTQNIADLDDWAACTSMAEPKPELDSNGCAVEPPVSGYSAWFDGRDISGRGYPGTQTDASAVTLWANKGLSGEHTYQTTGAAQPTLDDDCVSANGAWCISFDGGDKLSGETASNWNFVNAGTDQSLFFLGKKTGVGGDQGLWSTGGYTSIKNGTLFYIALNSRSWGQGDIGANFVVNLNVSPSAGLSDSAQKIWSFTVNFDNDGKGYLNGTQTATDTSFTASQANDGSSDPLTIGAYAGVFYYTGNLQQAIQYPSALSTQDRESVEEWLECVGGL